MKVLLSFAAAGLAVVAAGSVVQAQHRHGGHVHGGHVHGGYYGGGHVHGGFYGGHVHGGYYGGHLHGGHIHILPSAGYYYGSGYPYSYGSSYYPSVTTIVPVTSGPSTSLKPNPLPTYTGPGVTLRLPADFRGSVYVQVDKREVELKPGSEVVLKDKASYVVEFDRGGDFGAARHELTEGVYKLVVGEKGWQVVPDAAANGGLRRNTLPDEPKK